MRVPGVARNIIAAPLLLLLLMLLTPWSASGDVYNSASQLASVLQLERRLVQLATELHQHEPHEALGSFLSDSHPIQTFGGNIVSPLDAYHMLRRLTSDFGPVRTALLASGRHDIVSNVTEVLSSGLFPNVTDLNEAAFALVRLQDIYQLDAAELLRGRVRQHRSPWTLTGKDCVRLSQQSLTHMEFELAEVWNQAATQLTTEEEELAALASKLKNIRATRELVLQLARRQPDRFVGRFAGAGIPLGFLGRVVEEADPEDGDAMKDIERRYKQLCRGETVLSPAVTSRFHCAYKRSTDPYFLLRPLKTELLWPEPLIVRFHDVTSARQRGRLARLAAPRLVTSRVGGRSGNSGRSTQGRVGKMAFLRRDSDPLVKQFHRLAEAFTGLSSETAEDLQVVNYGLGGHYEPHVDFYDSYENGDFSFPRDRLATFLFYLNSVGAGGATVFPLLGVAAPPVPGSALFWYNLRRSGRADSRTVHAACPVLLGAKSIANFWLHEAGQEFRRPCGTGEDD